MALDLSAPHLVTVDMGMGGRWYDVTSDVRQKPPIQVTQGRADEQAELTASTCRFTIDNSTGDYSPRNPLGAWYGLLKQNTPVRVALDVGSDDFARTAATGWGDSPRNGTWTTATVGTATTLVSGGEGVHAISAASSYALTYLTVAAYDVDVCVTVDVDVVAVSGAAIELANILVRGAGTDYYLLRFELKTSGRIDARWMYKDTDTIGTVETDVQSWVGAPLRVRAQVSGHTLRGKIWTVSNLVSSGTGEPTTWNIVRSVDADFNSPALDQGVVGIRTGLASGNTNTKPVVVRYTNLLVTMPRFAGELASLTPYTNETHSNVYVEVEATGVTRRLQQGVSPLAPAIQRQYATYAAEIDQLGDTHYIYPLSTGSTSTGSSSLTKPLTNKSLNNTNYSFSPGQATLDFSAVTDVDVSSRSYFGKGDLGRWIGNAVTLSKNIALHIPVRTFAANVLGTSTGGFRLSFVVAYDGGVEAGDEVVEIRDASGTDVWTITMTSVTETITVERVVAGVTVTNDVIVTAGVLFNGNPHLVVLRTAELFGDSPSANLKIDGVEHGTSPGITTSFPTYTEIIITSSSDNSRSFGHVYCSSPISFYLDDNFTLDAANATFGYSITNCNFDTGCLVSAEEPDQRIARLCAEDDVDVDVAFISRFDEGDTEPATTDGMGPQGLKTLVDLLRECEAVDNGIIYESRASTGYVYRRYDSLLNQTARLTLDYAAGDVAADLVPTFDDQLTRNQVTASRPEGEKITVELTSGALSTTDPPAGVGRYDDAIELNVANDSQLGDPAAWLVSLGTMDEDRYPQVTVVLDTLGVFDAGDALDVNVGDVIALTNMQNRHVYDDVFLLVRGYSEVLDQSVYRITYNCTPASVYDVIELGTTGYTRLAGSNTTLAEDLTTTETDVTVTIAAGSAPWTTADEPFDVFVGGERMTVTTVTGTSSPQTFTVTRSVNGIVTTHSTGATVTSADPLRTAQEHHGEA